MRRFFILIYIIIFSLPVYSQYFGRNKVQYERFDFKSLKTDHFNILFYPETELLVNDAAFMLERWYKRFRKIFVSKIENNQPIILYANHADFQQTNVIGGLIPQGTGGVTEGLQNRIVLPFTGILEENDHVLGHELVHAFQYNIIKSSPQGIQSSAQVPLWFIEGLAEYLTMGQNSSLTAMWLRDAVLNNDVPSISDISSNYKYFPYRYGHALWAFIGSTYGDKIVSSLFSSVMFSNWEDGFRNILNTSIDSLSRLWEKSVREVYAPQIEGKTHPERTGEPLIEDEGGMNLSPSLSPDGNTVAFISRRELFTLDLYLANAATGEIKTKLVSSNTDAHFDAIRIMNTSGSWSPDGKRFAFMTVSEGDEEVAIADVSSGDIERSIRVPGADAIYHVSWSPSGESLLLSGGTGGMSDIMIYDFNNKNVVKLTNDKFSDIQPSWSPDGKKIIFSTDRGEPSDTNSLDKKQLKLALMDLDSKEIQLITINDSAKHINPFFTPDGKSVCFVSDPDGFSNIYRYSLTEKQFYKITNTATGISGLTENSPAISLSGNKIVFTVFNNSNYTIRSISPGAGILYEEPNIYAMNTELPSSSPLSQPVVNSYLADNEDGLPEVKKFEISDYKSKLDLLYIGQPVVGIAIDQYNSGVAGSVSALFGDMLGNHLLGAAVQIQGSFEDLGGQIIYQNMTSRVNWGVSIGHIPYMSGYVLYGRDTVNIDGNRYNADLVTLIRQRIFLTGGSLFTFYPLTANRRFELSVGYTHTGYDIEAETSTSVGTTVVSQVTESLPAPPGINEFSGGVAYVGDFSFFGFTSPVYGSRFRLELESKLGTFEYVTLLADYRRYFFFNPLTFAVRGVHYGRYFGDSERPELSPLFLGYETFVRGYAMDSFNTSDCVSGDCLDFDKLTGSRIAFINAEFRLPLFGTEEFGLIDFPYLPAELVAFFDGGIAWTRNESPLIQWELNPLKRTPVFSAGASARVNFFGYMVLEFFYAYPFQRPGKGMQFGINFQPGW